MTNPVIPAGAVEAAAKAYGREFPYDENGVYIVKLVLEAAAPHITAQTLTDAVNAFPLETITAPDTAVVWLMRRAEEIRMQS